MLWKRRPIHLTVFVTRRCNARCGFCFTRGAGEGADGAEITADEMARVARSAGTLLWLAFSGGEIFLREDLPELVEAAARPTRPVIILLPTNGLLPARTRAMTEAVLASCAGSTVVVKVSIDGPPPLHDQLRGVPGAFERAAETLRLLADLAARSPRLEVGVNSVLCSANADRTEELAATVRALPGVRTHTVSLVRGDLPDPAPGDVDADRYREATSRLDRGLRSGGEPVYRFRGARLKAAQDVLQHRLIHRTLLERRQVLPCHAGRLNLVLSETGDLYPCENFRLRLGNVRDHGHDLRATASSPEARAVLAGIRRGACWCTHECYAMTNILFSPRCHPALIAEYLRLLARSSR